jgi:membrane-associated phospholipid phosphatase
MGRTALGTAIVAALLMLAPTAGAERKVKHPADGYRADVASAWFDALYDVVRSEKTPPPPASRIYGIAAVALYESVVPASLANRSLAGQLNGLTAVPQPRKNSGLYHWPAVANAALARTIRGIFTSLSPESLDALDALEASFDAQFRSEAKKNDVERSVAHGQAVADAILLWAATDDFAALANCPYAPAPVSGAWVPTPPAFNPSPVQPCWGQIRPMVPRSGTDCLPPGHPTFSTDTGSVFYAAALEVYDTNLTLTAEQRTIADFWADNAGATGTPPGHWIAIVGQLARTGGLSLMAAAEAYARVGIAVTDAFIECWSAKYVYNLQRPVTYIRNHIDATWLPYLVTPNFPTYTSGHSTQSAAAATVLTDMFGVMAFTDTIRADHALVPPLAPRTFGSFHAAAAEAAVSRLYAGIHFAFDNQDGLAAGQCIGQMVIQNVRFREDD